MAATDLSAETLPTVGFLTKRVTLDASANNAREVILPTWARRVSIYVKDGSGTIQPGDLAGAGTDGAAIGNDTFPITAAGLTWRPVPGRSPGGGSIFLSASTASSFAHVMLEQE